MEGGEVRQNSSQARAVTTMTSTDCSYCEVARTASVRYVSCVFIKQREHKHIQHKIKLIQVPRHCHEEIDSGLRAVACRPDCWHPERKEASYSVQRCDRDPPV